MARPENNAFVSFVEAVCNVVEKPVIWWRETVVTPNQQKYNWYHRQYRRVPTIDQCYTDDHVCSFEAQAQFLRDKNVDDHILKILRDRFLDCRKHHVANVDADEKCADLWETYEENAGYWFCKYGDLGAYGTAKDAYMKQKHRLIWERRHGAVGSGMKTQVED